MDFKKCMINNTCKTCFDNTKCNSKYKNKKSEYKGIKFDSKKEMLRYIVLEDMQKKGEIEDLQLQVPFVLIPPFELNGKKYKGMRYLADFTYKKDGKVVVEDVKASATFQTDVYKIKKKLMAYVHNIEIKEVM